MSKPVIRIKLREKVCELMAASCICLFGCNESSPWIQISALRLIFFLACVLRGENGGGIGQVRSSAIAERCCASSSRSRSRIRLRSFPCCSDFLPSGGELLQRADARRILLA